MRIEEFRDICKTILESDPQKYFGDLHPSEIRVVDGDDKTNNRQPGLLIIFPGGDQEPNNAPENAFLGLGNMFAKLNANDNGFTYDDIERNLYVYTEMFRESRRLDEMLRDWNKARQHLSLRISTEPLHESCIYKRYGDLILNAVLDFQHAVCFVLDIMAERWGVTADEVLQEAQKSFEKLTDNNAELELVEIQVPNPVNDSNSSNSLNNSGVRPMQPFYGCFLDDDNEATMVALPTFVDRVPIAREDMYFSIPARNRLMFFRKPTNLVDLLDMIFFTQFIYERYPHAISTGIYEWKNGEPRLVSPQYLKNLARQLWEESQKN